MAVPTTMASFLVLLALVVVAAEVKKGSSI
jgi:hypothetical protein